MLALPALGEVLMVTSRLHPARDLPSTPHPRTEPEISGSTAPTEAPDDATAQHTVPPWGDFPV